MQHRRRALNAYARKGPERLKQGAKTSLVQALGAGAIKPLARLFSLKHGFPTGLMLDSRVLHTP